MIDFSKREGEQRRLDEPVGVNADLAERETLEPRAATFGFLVVDEKINVTLIETRPHNEEVARDFYDDAKRKALELEEMFWRTQFDEKIRAHTRQLVARLGVSYADMRLGQLIPLLRSLESDVRAYDRDEGRNQLGASHLSQVLDLTSTVRDLCSIFPVLREIECEAASLNVPPQQISAIRGHIHAVVEILKISEGLTGKTRLWMSESAANIRNQRGSSEEAKESAYFLIDFAEFIRTALRHSKNTELAVRGETAENSGASGDGATVGRIGALLETLGGEIAALGKICPVFAGLSKLIENTGKVAPGSTTRDLI